MEVIYQKETEQESVILYKRWRGDVDVRFIKRNDKREETFNNRIELSVYNHNAQEQLNELFEMYQITPRLHFQLTDILKDFPEMKRF